MNDQYTSNTDILNQLFLDNYFDAYKKVKHKDKSKLLSYVSATYRKWLYSAMVEETILTPANVFYKLNEPQTEEQFVFPNLYFDKAENKDDFSFANVTYSIQNHPIVNDLRIFLSLCDPNLDLTEDDTLSEDACFRFAKELSLQDPNYASYLFDLSVHLRLLKKMPSIYASKAQRTPQAKTLFTKSNADILGLIFHACLDLLVFQVASILPDHSVSFPKKFFLDLIQNPRPIDSFFQEVYLSLGINLEGFMSELEEDSTNTFGLYDGFGDALISSTYLLGVTIDKYLLTPMGHYLKLIMPVYALPFHYDEELPCLYEALRSNMELNPTLWMPCSNFFLTKMGLQYLNILPNYDNYIELPDNIPIDFLLANIQETIALHLTMSQASQKNLPVSTSYTIKAVLRSAKKISFSFDVHEDAALSCIHDQICDMLLLDAFADYSLSVGESESPFLTFVSAKSRKKLKKANAILIKGLSLEKGQTLTYFMPNTSTALVNTRPMMKIDLTVTSVKNASPHTFYPFVSWRSKAYIDWERAMEMNDFF